MTRKTKKILPYRTWSERFFLLKNAKYAGRMDDVLDVTTYVMSIIAAIIVAVLCCSCANRPPRNPMRDPGENAGEATIESSTAAVVSS